MKRVHNDRYAGCDSMYVTDHSDILTNPVVKQVYDRFYKMYIAISCGSVHIGRGDLFNVMVYLLWMRAYQSWDFFDVMSSFVHESVCY